MKWGLGVLALALAACGGKTETAETVPPVASAEAAGPKVVTPADIPLERGFYVESSATCADASNSTLYLLRRKAISTSHVLCEFTKVEQTGATTFKVTQSCTDDGAAFGGQDKTETRTETYDAKSPKELMITYDGGGTANFNFCEQASLPEPWKNNDIKSLIED